MSKTIDEKVVEMKFDNKQFEANVQTSLSTLDKLKQKLNLNGATKGLNDVKESAKNLSFNNIVSSLASLEKRFSTTGIVGMTVIQNLTTAAMGLAKKLSSNAIDSILGGGKRRATNLENARFQLQGLLNDAGKVEAVMKDVDYAVSGTAYSLDAAAGVASQLSASSIEAGDGMKKALRGVAGVAAMTNSSYEDIGRIYTQVAGQGRLMGDQLLQLSGRGMNAAATLAKYLNKTEAEVRDMTSKGKISFETFAAAMDDAFGEHAKAANNTVNGAMANIKSALARIGALFYEPILKQKGPLVQFLNAVREGVNSLKKSMEPIAEKVTTKINNALLRATEIFKAFMNVLNWSPLVKFKDTLKGMSDTLKGTLKPLNSVKDSLNNVKHTVEDYNKVVDQIIRGDFKNAPVRYQLLAEAGYDWAYAQNLVNERLGSTVRHATNFNPVAEEMNQNTENMAESTEDLVENLIKLSKEELIAKGFTEEQAEAIKTLGDVSKKTGISVKELLKLIDNDQFDSKFLIFNSFKNIGMGLVTILKSIGSALAQVFSVKSEGLFDIIAAIHKFTMIFNEKIQRNAEGLTNTLKGLFSIIHLITSIIGGGFKLALKLLNAVLGAFNLNILDVTGGIGELIFKFEQWLTKESGLIVILKRFVQWIAESAVKVKDFVTQNEKIMSVLRKLKDSLKNAKDGIKGWINGFKDIDNVPKYIFEGLINGLKNGAKGAFEAIGNVATGLIEFFKGILGIHSPSTVFFAIGGFIIAGLIAGLKSQSLNIFDVLSGIGNKMIEFFKNLKLGDVISVGVTAGLIMMVNKVLNIVQTIVNPLKSLNNVFNSLAGMLNDFGDAAQGFGKRMEYEGIASMIKSIGITLAILAASLVVLGKLPYDELIQGGIALGILSGVLALFVVGIALMSKRLSRVKLPDMGKTLAVLLGVAISISIIAGALKKIGKIPADQIGTAVFGLMSCVLGMVALVVALGVVTDALKGTKNINKIGNVFLKIGASMMLIAVALKMMKNVQANQIYTMIGIFVGLTALLGAISAINYFTKGGVVKAGETIKTVSLALVLLVVAMKLSGSLKKQDFINGIGVITTFLAFITALMLISKKFKGTEMMKVSGSILLLVAALGGMALVMKLLANMDPEGIKKGMKCITGISAILAVLIAVSKETSSGHGLTLLGMSAMILAMAGATVLLGMMDPEKVKNGIKAVGALSIFVGILTRCANGIKAGKNAKAALVTLTVMIGLLAVAMVALSFIEPKRLLSSATALGEVMISLGLLVAAVGHMKISKGIIGTVILLTAITAAMAGIIAGLSMLPNPQGAIQSATGVAILMGALGVMAIALNKFDQRKKINFKGILQLAALIPIVVGIAAALAIVGNVQNAVGNAAAITILLAAMTGVLAGLGAIGKYLGGKMVLGLVGMVALIGELFLVVELLRQMDGLQNAAQNCVILGIFVGVLSLALLAIAGVGAIYAATCLIAMLGLVGMVALIGELFLVVELLRQMQDIQNVMPNVMALTLLLGALTDCLVKIALVGPLAIIADAAIFGLIGAITTMGVLATAVGALMDKFPQLQDFLNKGLPVLEQIAQSIGKVLGNLVGGFLDGATEGLPEIGNRLSQFMVNALPFITIAQTITDRLGTGVKYLSDALFSLIGANLLDAIVQFISNGESFSRLGTELTKFITAAMPFIAIMSTIDPNIMNGAKAMADAILSLTAGNLLQQVTGWLTGKTDMSEFGSQLGSLGTGLSKFIANLQGFGEDKITIVDAACQALKTLADTAKEIPATGGLWQWLAGENDIGSFAEQLPNVATGITGFVSELVNGGFSEDKIAIVESACKALKCLAEVAKAIPKSDGFWQWLSGDQDLKKFAEKFPDVAKGITSFVNGLKDFPENAVNKVNAACNVMWAIKDLAGADLNNITSKSEELGNKLVTFANKIKEFAEGMNSVSEESLESTKQRLQKIIEIANSMTEYNTDALEKFSESLSKFGKEAIQNFVTALNDENFKTQAQNAIIDMINKVIDGAESKRGDVENKAKEVADSAANGLENNSSKDRAYNAGVNFVSGFANGIRDKGYLATNEASSLGKKALEAARKSLDEHSPSKETFKIGEFFTQGLVNGIKALRGRVYDSSSDVGEKAKDGLMRAISKISNIIDDDIDMRPTIRPVLDLSDIKDGAGNISSMFTNPSLAVASNLGAISTGMARNRQNGNDDVVSAINKLGKSLSGRTGNTYNVNGITYDDGSEISNAVSELVRAARVERRV